MKKILKSKFFWLLFLLIIIFTVRFYTEYKIISENPVQSWLTLQSADCGVVLTGSVGRVREGFDLLSNHQIKKLIISGVYNDVQMRELLPMWAFYGDLKENDIVLEKRSETTYGNASQSLAIVEALKCRDIILVTSRSHMHRAYKTFKGSFPENIYIYKHSVINGRFEASVWENTVESLKSLFYSLWAY